MSSMIRFDHFGDNDVLYTADLAVSEPDALQVLVKVYGAGINPMDFRIRSGQYPSVREDRLPYTLGREVCGVIEQCGAQAPRFAVGDEVFGIVDIHGGGYAEHVVVDQHALARKPAGLDYLQAAAVPLAGSTAWQGLFKYGRLESGQSILIQGGSGGVGHFAVQFAKAHGARVLTTVSTANVEFAHDLGADVVIDYKKQRFEDYAHHVDMVFDLIGGQTRERSWPVLRRGGVLVTTRDTPSAEQAAHFGVRALRFTVEADGADLERIASRVDMGLMKPHIEAVFDLEAARKALASVETGHTVGKVVLRVG